MKKNLYCGLAAFTAFALTACSDDSSVSAVTEPAAANSSSSLIEESSSSVVGVLSSSAIVESSSSVFAESSSSSFGLSSSDVVSSSSFVNSSSSSLVSSSSSSLLVSSSSSKSCPVKNWAQLGGKYPYVEAEFCESSWPEGAIPDGKWRLVEIDTSCVYCTSYVTGEPTRGNSSVIWMVGESENDEVPTSTIEACEGVCGTAVLKKGTLSFQPFVSIGFAFARDSSGNPVPVDVSDWGGICVNYGVEAPPSLELDLGDSLNAVLDYAQPAASFAKSSYAQKCFTWDQFKFPSWFKGEAEGWRENTGVVASKRLVGVRFKIQAREGQYNFRIWNLSSYDKTSFRYSFY